MKAGGGHAKGADFERIICRELSLWWSEGKRDDIFWRTPQSGGRATSRGKQGKSTFGHHGDILATDPIGLPLLDFMTFELKCGYARDSLMELIDGTEKAQWYKWITGAMRVKDESGSKYWCLIVKRPRRRVLICYPWSMNVAMGCDPWPEGAVIRHPVSRDLLVIPFDDFLARVSPKTIEGIRSGVVN